MSGKRKNLWANDHVQMARLIDEADAAGAFTEEVLQTMSDSMDLTKHEIIGLIDRGRKEWERLKAQNCPVVTAEVPEVEPRVKVSLDGGVTYRAADEGVRVVVDDMFVADNAAELHLNVTGEGLIMDVWEVGGDEPSGTSSETFQDIVGDLTEQED